MVMLGARVGVGDVRSLGDDGFGELNPGFRHYSTSNTGAGAGLCADALWLVLVRELARCSALCPNAAGGRPRAAPMIRGTARGCIAGGRADVASVVPMMAG